MRGELRKLEKYLYHHEWPLFFIISDYHRLFVINIIPPTGNKSKEQVKRNNIFDIGRNFKKDTLVKVDRNFISIKIKI